MLALSALKICVICSKTQSAHLAQHMGKLEVSTCWFQAVAKLPVLCMVAQCWGMYNATVPGCQVILKVAEHKVMKVVAAWMPQ